MEHCAEKTDIQQNGCFRVKYRSCLWAFAVGWLLRFMLFLPGGWLSDWQRFCRPDSSGYLAPVHGLLNWGSFCVDGVPSAVRAPGFSWFSAGILKLSGGNWDVFQDFSFANIGILAVVMLTLNALMIVVVYFTGMEFSNRRTAAAAAWLTALNPTAAAQAPMMLSDSLFGLFAAVQLYLLVAAWKRKKLSLFLAGFCIAAAGTLIRPINSLWFLPGVVLLLFLPEIPLKKKFYTAGVSLLLWGILVFPWMFRNRAIGSGFCIDTNTGSMYHQNGAVLLAAVNGTDYETEKQNILRELQETFRDTERFPDMASQSEYRMERYKELIRQYPLRWFFQQFQWKVCLPDLATCFELIGVTKSDRGTFNVLKTKGLWAAVNHYFDGRLYLPAMAFPLLLCHAVLLVGALGYLVVLLRDFRKNIFVLLLALAMIEYYIFLPGSITVPRYLLPGIPLLAVFAGTFLTQQVVRWYQTRRSAR